MQVILNLSQKQLEDLTSLCVKNKMSQTDLIHQAIGEFLQRYTTENLDDLPLFRVLEYSLPRWSRIPTACSEGVEQEHE